MNNNYHFYLDKNYILPLIYLIFVVVISQLFIGPDRNANMIYYMIMFLLYLSIYNIKTSIAYYVKLRNHKGLRGDRGDPGDMGSTGVDGTCIMSKGCGLLNCRKLISDELLKKYPDLVPINNKVENNIKLNPNEKRKYDMMSNYIDILLPQCKEYDEGVDKFRKLIAKTLK